jgi:hypothetical protein
VKRILLLVLTAAAFAVPAGAHAAVPCRDRIYNEWYASGKISTSYPISCYHDALTHIPGDARVYSNLGSDIKAALQAALARQSSGGGPSSVGSGPASNLSTTSQTKAAVETKIRGGDGLAAAPVATTTGSSGIPLPILVLGGVALALAAAGAVGTGVKLTRSRRRA